jgi:hypothetical protein
VVSVLEVVRLEEASHEGFASFVRRLCWRLEQGPAGAPEPPEDWRGPEPSSGRVGLPTSSADYETQRVAAEKLAGEIDPDWREVARIGPAQEGR